MTGPPAAGTTPWRALRGLLIIPPMPTSSYGIARLPRSALARQLTRIRAGLRHGKLDAALAAGQDPWSAGDLMLRASALSSLPMQTRLAASLEGLVDAAELQPVSPPFVRTRTVLSHRESLLALLVDLKCFQRMARFCSREEIPHAVTDHVRHGLGLAPETGA